MHLTTNTKVCEAGIHAIYTFVIKSCTLTCDRYTQNTVLLSFFAEISWILVFVSKDYFYERSLWVRKNIIKKSPANTSSFNFLHEIRGYWTVTRNLAVFHFNFGFLATDKISRCAWILCLSVCCFFIFVSYQTII